MLLIQHDDSIGEVEKELADKEYSLKKPKAKSKAKAAQQAPAPEGRVIDVDDDVWSIPSDDDLPVAFRRANKMPKRSEEDDAAKAAKKLAQETNMTKGSNSACFANHHLRKQFQGNRSTYACASRSVPNNGRILSPLPAS